jgi:oligopeptide/dipeptide ABC transporter ATP-binding protein
MAMIVITHDMGVIAEVADEVVVMYAGQVVEQAPVTELFARPEHPYTEALLGALPQLEDDTARAGRLTAIAGRPPDLLDPPEGCRFAARCAYANEFDGCATHMPALRELRPGHLVRSEHPATERARRREAAPA